MKRARRPPLVQRRWRSGLGGGGAARAARPIAPSFSLLPSRRGPHRRRPPLPFSAATLLCSQLLQYGSGLPEQIGHPTKRGTTPPPHPLWVLSAGTLYQVLNATAEAMNEIMGVGAAWRRGWSSSTGESGHVWGGGDSRFRSSLFYPTAQGFRGAQPDRTPPSCPPKSPLH